VHAGPGDAAVLARHTAEQEAHVARCGWRLHRWSCLRGGLHAREAPGQRAGVHAQEERGLPEGRLVQLPRGHAVLHPLQAGAGGAGGPLHVCVQEARHTAAGGLAVRRGGGRQRQHAALPHEGGEHGEEQHREREQAM